MAKSAIDRLTEQLDAKDEELDRLHAKVDDLEARIRSLETGWMEHLQLPAEQALPVPRLEILLEDTTPEDLAHHNEGRGWSSWRWRYRLVMRHFLGHCVAIPLGETTSSGGRGGVPREFDDKTLRLPFRDGAHIQHDAWHFNLPAFIVCGDEVQTVEPKPRVYI